MLGSLDITNEATFLIFMNYFVLGLNHQTAPVQLREKLAVTREKLPSVLDGLISLESVSEGLLLSTCNRVEVYAVGPEAPRGLADIRSYISRQQQIAPGEWDGNEYFYEGEAAVNHLFRVVSSLDSMIVGEPQIVGQVRDAYKAAQDQKTVGQYINRLLEKALWVSKKIRTDTQIAAKPVSVGSAAVFLAGQVLGNLTSKKAALIGIGKMGQLVFRHLQENGIGQVLIVNRNTTRHLDFLNEPADCIYPLEKMETVLDDVDCAVFSSSSEKPLLTKALLSRIMERRKNRQLVLIDLGMPRNIEDQCQELPQVYLYNVDDLSVVSDQNLGERLKEAQLAEEIVKKEASQFFRSMVLGVPTMAKLGQKMDMLRSQEVEKTLSKLRSQSMALSIEQEQALVRCTEAIVSKILHEPSLILREVKNTEQHSSLHGLIWKIFKLDDD